MSKIVSKADHFLNVIEDKAETKVKATLLPITFRMPIEEVAFVDSLAALGEITRTKVLVELLAIAKDELLRVASPQQSKWLREEYNRQAQSLYDTHSAVAAEEVAWC